MKLIMTLSEIEKTAVENGFNFIVYPQKFNFDNPYDRVIFPEESKSIIANQHKVIDEGGEFDKFLADLSVGNSIKTKLENTYYDKPLYILTIKSGATIMFDVLKNLLERANDDYSRQTDIVNHFYVQLTVASIKGIIRELYTSFLVTQNGKESKYSNSKCLYSDCYIPLINSISFNADTENKPFFIEKLYDISKEFAKSNLSPETADRIYNKISKLCKETEYTII